MRIMYQIFWSLLFSVALVFLCILSLVEGQKHKSILKIVWTIWYRVSEGALNVHLSVDKVSEIELLNNTAVHEMLETLTSSNYMTPNNKVRLELAGFIYRRSNWPSKISLGKNKFLRKGPLPLFSIFLICIQWQN